MSDSVKDLEKRYEENVFPEKHPRSIGLFTIPEYPEYESERGMWSAALDAILTTLRYLAPATLLTLFWGQQSFFFKILKHIDSAFRAIVFSSEEQKQAVLEWMADVGPVRVEQLDTVWRHGWILCGVLDAALPGACAGHPPTRLSLKHAQAIADHYLGVEPVFSRQELESNDSLSRHQEWKLATYLDRIRQALAKLTPPVSKPTSQRTSPETTQFTLDYVAKGSGLTAAQVKNKMSFKIYPTAQQSLDPGEIAILIRGPKDTYGMTVFAPILGKAQILRQKLLGLQTQQSYTENALPITHGAAYFRSYGKNDMTKTYYIPKTNYDIEIEVDMRPDHAKISYVVNLEGRYEISITSRGQSIVGSPFTVTASHNIIGILEKESFCLEDGEEIDIVDVKTDRKVVLRIVDFVTEKMLLKENGSLEKISDEEAKLLMATDSENETFDNKPSNSTFASKHENRNTISFNNVVHKVLIMNRICKIFNDQVKEKRLQSLKDDKNLSSTKCQKDIPDIVNSTFSETNTNPFILTEKRSKFIVPESIAVSIRTEKSKLFYEGQLISTDEPDKPVINIPSRSNSSNNSPYNLQKYETQSKQLEDDNIFIDTMSALNNTNPFVSNAYNENLIEEKNLCTFVASDYETNNSQEEETRDTSIKIIIDPSCTPSISPRKNNPFEKEDTMTLERPKSPVFKMMLEGFGHDYPKIEESKSELIPEEMLGNEFVNPFFIHHHQLDPREQLPITDFIIGAPVSLPPIIRASSPKPDMKSLIMTTQNEQINTFNKNTKSENNTNDANELSGTFLTPVHADICNATSLEETTKANHNLLSSRIFQGIESNLIETLTTTSSENPYELYKSEDISQDNNSTLRKETWDSAYVSIDDNNSTPDNNNNDNTIGHVAVGKQKYTTRETLLELKNQEIHVMGPAEKEIWQTCHELNEQKLEELKPNKWDMKRPVCTPIIEENDKSISSGIKDISRSEFFSETDEVSVAFAELNEIYTEYFPLSVSSSTAAPIEDNNRHGMDVDNNVQNKKSSVDSASEQLSDVKRHENKLEGTISEVQSNVAESLSVSQTLLDETNKQAHRYTHHTTNETQFGDSVKSNIVLERKKYWDEKIRQLEATSQEATILPKKKRATSSKQMKHDSLSKRKGKQMIKNFLNAGGYNQTKHIEPMNTTHNEEDNNNLTSNEITNEQVKHDEKIVEKWKKYWDDKLIKEHESNEAILTKPKSQANLNMSAKPDDVTINNEISLNKDVESQILTTPIQVKQELPEEVFKAFETSPKRFFGTSRKQILSKIDIFSARSSSSEESSPEIVDMSHDSGLVSSRISLFHTLSNTEELPWVKKKSKSMHNIYHGKDNKIEPLSKNNLQAPLQVTKTSILKSNDLKRPVSNNENVNIMKDCKLKSQTLNISLKDKRARITDTSYNKTVEDETICQTSFVSDTENTPVTKATNTFNLSNVKGSIAKPSDILRKKSFSKSEMDIFSKVPNSSDDDYLEKYKSCDELPRINVKSFISLYEGVTKTAVEAIHTKRIYRTSSVDSQKLLPTVSNNSDADWKHEANTHRTVEIRSTTSNTPTSSKHTPDVSPKKLTLQQSSESTSNIIKDKRDTEVINAQVTKDQDKETTYVSLSDIELEIIESSPDKSSESSPERITVAAHVEYRNRFKMAREYFQSLEELREVKKPRKLNECELLLNKSNESLETSPPQRRKKKLKSHSLPSSEISKIWNQLQENKKEEENDARLTKLVKISEKFHVDDLFSDVMEGRLSRQGSLRGIPNKKAVLETFRSMENIADNRISSYEMTESQLNDFAKENSVKNAQTYLKEYPYLPTTDPSKYHSRVDVKASGLISFKELLQKRHRRNSVPDLRLNPKFTEDL